MTTRNYINEVASQGKSIEIGSFKNVLSGISELDNFLKWVERNC